MNTAGPRPPPRRPLARGRQLLLLRLDHLQVAWVATGSLHRAGCPDQIPTQPVTRCRGGPGRHTHADADALEAGVGERFGILRQALRVARGRSAGRGPRTGDGNRSARRTITWEVR